MPRREVFGLLMIAAFIATSVMVLYSQRKGAGVRLRGLGIYEEALVVHFALDHPYVGAALLSPSPNEFVLEFVQSPDRVNLETRFTSRPG